MYVLPISPINTFAGAQFQIKKPKIAPEIAQEDVDAINSTPHPATSPSRPSMKFVKFMIAVISRTETIDNQMDIGRSAKPTRIMAVTN
jgi:hypothetical protein